MNLQQRLTDSAALRDEPPNVLTVPADPATEALIEASIVAHQMPERALTALPLTVVQYGGRWSVVTGHPLDSRSGGDPR